MSRPACFYVGMAMPRVWGEKCWSGWHRQWNVCCLRLLCSEQFQWSRDAWRINNDEYGNEGEQVRHAVAQRCVWF
jgi:hypothetical protein